MKYNKKFDLLSVGHFIFFFIIGKICKNQYQFAFILGILWELFEYTITSNPCTRKLLAKYHFVPQSIWDEDLFNQNRVYDMIFNMLGYYISSKN